MTSKAEQDLHDELWCVLKEFNPGFWAQELDLNPLVKALLDHLKDNRYLFTAGGEVHKVQDSEFMDNNGESVTWHVWTEPEEDEE